MGNMPNGYEASAQGCPSFLDRARSRSGWRRGYVSKRGAADLCSTAFISFMVRPTFHLYVSRRLCIPLKSDLIININLKECY